MNAGQIPTRMDKFSVNTPFVILISEDPNVRAFFAALRGIQCTAGARPMLDSLPDLGDRPVIVALDVDDFGGPALLSRALSKLENVPVIVIAPRSQAHTVKTALNLGAFDHLEKPLDPDLAHFALKRATGFLELRNLKSYFEKMLDETLQERIGEVTRKSDLLQGILNSSTLVSIVVTDTDQNVLFWNTGAQNIFGYTANEMIGSKITKLYIPDADSTEVVRTLQSEVKTRFGTVYGKMRQLTKDGRVVTVSLALSPTRDSSGANTGILGIGLDVTEEERLNEQLIEKNIELQKTNEELVTTQDVSILALAKLAECRDKETGMHLERIKEYCRILCVQLAKEEKFREIMTERFIEDLVSSSVLHDIGKVAIPDEILLSERVFTDEEYAIMKQHPIYGGRALEEAVNKLGGESFLSLGRDVAYYHHERWDGAGYPFGLKGQEIPLAARIVSVADVYDALTTKRRYKEAYTHDDTLKLMSHGRGSQFDPDLMDALVAIHEEFREIRNQLRDKPQQGSHIQDPHELELRVTMADEMRRDS